MTTDDRKQPKPNTPTDKKEEQVSDLPTREASGKDEQVKGGRMKQRPS